MPAHGTPSGAEWLPHVLRHGFVGTGRKELWAVSVTAITKGCVCASRREKYTRGAQPERVDFRAMRRRMAIDEVERLASRTRSTTFSVVCRIAAALEAMATGGVRSYLSDRGDSGVRIEAEMATPATVESWLKRGLNEREMEWFAKAIETIECRHCEVV